MPPTRMISPADQKIPLDNWYVAAFSREVGDKPLARECCGQPLVLYRSPSGQPAALEDRCPHRGVPLSRGQVSGADIQCVYHGIRFDAAGSCTHVPSQSEIPPRLSVKSFPTHERLGFVWVWMNPSIKPDLELLPKEEDVGVVGDDWQVEPYFLLPIKANYSMLFENLLDTSHISYLHGGAIDTGSMAKSKFSSAVEGTRVWIERQIEDDVATPAISALFQIPAGATYNRTLKSIAFLPNLHVINNTINYSDAAGARNVHVRLNIMPITPAGANQLYQFVSIATSYRETHSERMLQMMRKVLEEDRDVLELIQSDIERRGTHLPEISVRADQAALRARMRVAEMVAQSSPGGEHAQAS